MYREYRGCPGPATKSKTEPAEELQTFKIAFSPPIFETFALSVTSCKNTHPIWKRHITHITDIEPPV